MRISVSKETTFTAANLRWQKTFQPGEHTTTREIGEALVARGDAKEIKAPTASEAKAKKNG